ncbi:MAG: adenosylcobalamin-dependent ribonucleoside-diphosphate reductase, partial [Chloroflexi bacterium]|nr:adenosylcobalamin-dependent ribonucleoside-diphosphate reductase [Chloroflexota bacterium]
TFPVPDDGINPAEKSETAEVILEKRYLLRDNNGKIVENPQGMFRRVAHAIAKGDTLYGASPDRVEQIADRFYRMMASLDFLPNSPTLMNAGTGQGTLSACFVLPLADTMEGITRASHDQAMVQKFGGGTGFSLSDLRPKGWSISTTHGKACGPVETLRYLSATSRLVTQGGKRDGANMAVMDVHHPDIMEFITCKTVEGEIHNFNISVGASDEFMQAVLDNTDYPLYFRENPADINSPNIEVGRANAREVFEKIIDGAWLNGEPGMIFLDEVNRNSPVKDIGMITATNPCGEQPLLPYESCNLGSINLSNFVIGKLATGIIERTPAQLDLLRPEYAGVQAHTLNKLPGIDWDRMSETIRLAVHFLDNTIDVNEYAITEIRDMNLQTRKIGLGVMGFADMLVSLGIPYDSPEAVAVGRDAMRYIQEVADLASKDLAGARGPYGAWHENGVENPRMRNACRLTVAPTGTISMIAGCSSGIEPLFSLAFRKHNILGGDTTLIYADENFERVVRERGSYSQSLLDALASGESLQDRDDVDDDVKTLFHVSSDIAPSDHVLMQAAFQESVDAGISKTINFPNEATRADVEEAYVLAWETRCKGITVYRAGSREKEVLTAGTSEQTDAATQGTLQETDNNSVAYVNRMPRPPVLESKTVQVETGRGKIYVTLSFTSDGHPFEVFTNHGKAGGNDSAMAEALSRMISLCLRSGVSPTDVIDQLINIVDVPVWDRGRQILSVPDAIAKVLLEHAASPPKGTLAPGVDPTQTALLEPPKSNEIGMPQSNGKEDEALRSRLATETCPECFDPNMAYEEGCIKCYTCGYSKC